MRSTMRPDVPAETIEWLTGPDNPAVAVHTRTTLLGEDQTPELTALWQRRNEYASVAGILDAMRDDGSWDIPSRDYQKYRGTLWQIVILGELWADGADARVATAAEHAFSRQLPDGSWTSTAQASGSIACLTANVGRGLARLGYERDARVVTALAYLADLYREIGIVNCRSGMGYQLNGYCHMLAPKLLLFIGVVPEDLWPAGTRQLRDACVQRLAEKEIFRCLPIESREFQDRLWSMPAAERSGFRERFLAEHPVLHYKDKPGWTRFGFPLSYNSDALEALLALSAAGEPPAEPYRAAIDLVRKQADGQMRWAMRNSLNGKMHADVEAKGEPSKWLTLRALQVLAWAGR